MGRARIWQGLVGLYFALWLPLAGFAQDGCRQALALALDVSGSVDAREYRLQIGGLIAALDTSAVRNALLSLPGQPVELLVFEWSGAEDQHVLVDWTAIHSREDIAAFQERLRQTQRRATSPGTAIGHALETGHRMLDQRAACRKRTLDVSGDGKSNLGPDPAHIRTRLAAAGITVNALVIGADSPTLSDLRQADIAELSSYFRANVIAGPDAFVQTAIGYEGYAEAMARKLERELQTMVVSGLALQRSHSPR
jgi:hypothetical protein